MPVRVLGIKHLRKEEVQEMLNARNLKLASISRRVFALIIDVASVLLISLFVCWRNPWKLATLGEDISKTFFLFAFWICMPLYHAILVSLLGKTFGSLFARTDVIQMSGERIGVARGFIRGAILGLTIGIRFPLTIILHTAVVLITIRGNPFRLTVWDLFAQTVVVEQKAQNLSDNLKT